MNKYAINLKPVETILLAIATSLGSPVALGADESVDDGAQNNTAALAKKLQNPIANLISVPIQNNWDFGIGPADAMRFTANVQPVIPFSIGRDWNLITRTIMPFIHTESPVPGGSGKAGLGVALHSHVVVSEMKWVANRIEAANRQEENIL